MKKNRTLVAMQLPLMLVFWSMWSVANADNVLWISDASGNIGQVDISTQSVAAGSVHNTGQPLTDIAFNSTGTLFGTTEPALYSINASTGAATMIGTYSGRAFAMNALVGSGGTTLLGASTGTTTIYAINPSTASAVTFGTSPEYSAGDLAFSGSTLYESASSANGNELINLSTNSVVGLFHVGGTTFTAVYGLADNGTTMYAVDGTEVYSVNLTDATLTPLFDYSLHENGQSLLSASGAAFIGEGAQPVPLPASAILFISGLLGVGALSLSQKSDRDC